jgi:hypothetical protein
MKGKNKGVRSVSRGGKRASTDREVLSNREIDPIGALYLTAHCEHLFYLRDRNHIFIVFLLSLTHC